MIFRRPGLICGVLAILALAGGFAGCGGDDGPSDEELRQAREEGEKEGRDRERLRDLERQLREREKKEDGDNGRGGSPPSGGSPPATPSRTNCGSGIQAGPNTSCAFARNVRSDYYAAGGSGSMTLDVYSPTTDKTYAMSCSGGSPHVCTGGNNASVQFP